MGKINILNSDVFNRIAAGEVVEKPASIVKELVENSIDAGASQIKIEIFDGGKTIKVTDNGCGMDSEDVLNAFLPHATSKISSIDDLDSISTLGFRGEAIPSIAAVSTTTIISRREEDDFASKVICENGKIISHEECGSAKGTTVIVTNLFKNIPARLKFLRKDKTEENDITFIVDKLILANYNVSFSYFINDKEIRNSSGKGLNDALFGIYGGYFVKEHDYINTTMSGITLYGYINKPAYSKHNRNFQTLIVNGRYVVNNEVSFWIYNAYSSFLMKRQYPSYVLFLDIPSDLIDINVHPSKIEIKFVDIGLIKKLLNSAIYSTLELSTTVPKEIHISSETENSISEKGVAADNSKGQAGLSFIDFESSKPTVNATIKSTFIDSYKSVPVSSYRTENKVDYGAVEVRKDINATIAQNDLFDYLDADHYVGKLFNTYLMFEMQDSFILIDQHAAHEKILFEKYSKAIEENSVESQLMIFPFVFELDYNECELMDKLIVDLNRIGFDISKLSGCSYSMSAYPLSLGEFNPDLFIQHLTNAFKKGSINKLSFIRDDIIQMSCKAAVKGEMDLSDIEITSLINDIKSMRIELFCPHGRPIAVKFTRTEIEKWFKRIV